MFVTVNIKSKFAKYSDGASCNGLAPVEELLRIGDRITQVVNFSFTYLGDNTDSRRTITQGRSYMKSQKSIGESCNYYSAVTYQVILNLEE